MRWADLAWVFTPILATPQPRTRPVSLVEPDPDSGARWGRPSAFSWSNEAARTSPARQSVMNRTPSGALAEYMRIIPAQAQVASERVRVEAAAGTWIEIDRLTRMMFRYTEHLPRSSPSGLTPTLTTYFDLTFDLHPPATDEA